MRRIGSNIRKQNAKEKSTRLIKNIISYLIRRIREEPIAPHRHAPLAVPPGGASPVDHEHQRLATRIDAVAPCEPCELWRRGLEQRSPGAPSIRPHAVALGAVPLIERVAGMPRIQADRVGCLLLRFARAGDHQDESRERGAGASQPPSTSTG